MNGTSEASCNDLIRRFPPSVQRLLDVGAGITQIRRYPRRVDADARNGHCNRTWIVAVGALAHDELHGDGAVTVTSTPHALPEFRGQRGGQRVTRSAKSFRTGIPIIQVDGDRDAGHDKRGITFVSNERDGPRCR